jgi:hypothetical protein
MTKNRKSSWFKPVRKSYLPSSWQGLTIYFLYVIYIIAVPAVWCKHGHHLWSLLTQVIPLVTAAVILTQYIASKNSSKK